MINISRENSRLFSLQTGLSEQGKCMRRLLIRFVYLLVATQLVMSCASTQQTTTAVNDKNLQNERAVYAGLDLRKLAEIDSLVKLDNQHLNRQITAGLNAQALATGDFHFRKLKVKFGQQLITLQSTVEIADNTGNVITATASGDIYLDYSNNRLEWFPLFKHLQITSTDFSYADGSYAETVPELDQLVLKRLNTDITNALILYDNNVIPLNAVPLAEVEVGATLPGLNNASARQTRALNGVFVVAGSAMLIEPEVTTIALDMNFISDLSTCPADIEVSRAVFARTIKSREPVDLARTMTPPAELGYFYSEISGATRPMTIIHYWFADGKPVAVNELAVGASERWRTWSAKGRSDTGASHWEVLVVEKESGCILHSQSVRTLPDDEDASRGETNRTFASLRNEFNARISDFSISQDKPGIALVEIRRTFLLDVFKQSVAGLNIEASFSKDALAQLQFKARMLPFETPDIICDQHDCPAPATCTASVTQCKRIRDTRDCSSCLFYNPLNNRCVSPAVDPICEAARKRQNDKYDADRSACIQNVAAGKLACEQLNDQVARSCEIETGLEASTCELVRSGIEQMADGSLLANVNADTSTRGNLKVVFSRLRIEDDFSRLKLDMSLKSELEVTGKLKFTPKSIPAHLEACINTWNAPFSSRANTTAAADSIMSNLVTSETALTANWSGFTVPLTMTPSPLESVFVNNPQLLASCGIGLTVEKVEQVITGTNAGFFTGQMKLEVQPMPTRIKFLPATVIYGSESHSADAVLSGNYLRYDIAK